MHDRTSHQTVHVKLDTVRKFSQMSRAAWVKPGLWLSELNVCIQTCIAACFRHSRSCILVPSALASDIIVTLTCRVFKILMEKAVFRGSRGASTTKVPAKRICRNILDITPYHLQRPLCKSRLSHAWQSQCISAHCHWERGLATLVSTESHAWMHRQSASQTVGTLVARPGVS